MRSGFEPAGEGTRIDYTADIHWLLNVVRYPIN